MAKIKINDFAKNFDMKGKDIIEILKPVFGDSYKTVTALGDDETVYLLEYITQKHAVDDLSAYFAMQSDAPSAKKDDNKAEEAPVKSDELKKAEKAPIKAEDQPKAKNKPKVEAEKKAEQSDKPKVEKKSAPKPQEKTNDIKKNKDNKDNKNKKSGNTVHPDAVQPKPFEPKKKNSQQNAPSKVVDRTQVRTVDTRGVKVDLSKYDEKLDSFVSDRTIDKYVHGKQKIRQKKDNRSQYVSKKETEADKLRRLELEKARKQQLKVLIPDEITVGELASRLKVTAANVIKKIMQLGDMVTVNQTIDFDTASLVAMEFNAKVEKEVIVTLEERLIDTNEDLDENMEPRSPVVVVMGHVDHGKTSLLDAIRHANVVAGEAGGITQHIGAYRVTVQGREITFLDTPGHAAFTSMRARGAQVTDVAILVVAADDGIMPQTVEAINHAKAAGVSIVVAINKMDKLGANPDRIMQGLTEHGLIPEEWGGDVICVPVSAVKKDGIDRLLEMVLLTADMRELKANPNRAAQGTVIEARLDKGRGPVATVLVQNGTLHSGDVIIAGTAVGRVRVMTDDKGQKVKEAGPSVPVELVGLNEAPEPGDILNAVADERMARSLVEERKAKEKEEQFKAQHKVTLDNLFSTMQEGEMKALSIIVKADVQGSVEAVTQSLQKLSNEEVRVNVIHGAVGAITESDVMLAQASGAIIVGFNVRPQPTASVNAELSGIEIRLYRIIYDCIEDVEAAIKGMLAPKIREAVLGHAEVRDTFRVPGVGIIAGSYVTDGKVSRNALIRVLRDNIVIAEDKISSLKRFKDDAKEVSQSFECGIGLEKFNDIKLGDVLEAFILEEYRED